MGRNRDVKAFKLGMWIQDGKRTKYLESLSIWRKSLDNFNALLYRNGECPPCFISIENECIYLDTKYGLFGNYVSRNEAMQLCSEYQSVLLNSNQLIAYSSTIDNLIESQYQSIGSDFEPRQVLFWINETDHVFNFRNNKSSNQTDDFKAIGFNTNSSLEYEDSNSSPSESVSIVTKIPDWKQSFENTLDVVFNRQKRFSNDTEISDDQDIGDFDDFDAESISFDPMEIFLYEEEFSSFNSTIIGEMTITLPTSTTTTGTTTTTTTSSTVVQAIELK